LIVKLSLEPRLQQILAPQLIQSLRLLQMPTLRLEQLIRNELAQNPLLEIEEDEVEADEPEEETSSEEDVEESATDLSDLVEAGQVSDGEKLSDTEWEYLLGDDYEPSHKVRGAVERAEADEREPIQTYTTTISDHLHEQLHFERGLTQEERLAGEFLIGELDGRGYLRESLEALSSVSGHTEKLLEKMLTVIQGFDPPGVGARDLRESLLLQLRRSGQDNTLASKLVEHHLDELGSKSVRQLAQTIDATADEVNDALDLIRGLSPDPVAGLFGHPARYVTPDLVVLEDEEKFVVRCNDGNLPVLRVSPVYRDILRRGSKASDEEKQYVRQKLEQARWLISSIDQRRGTMTRVMEAIIDEQRAFFENGPEHLKPLTMEAIAQRVGVNISTVSRVANDKYVQTPYGVYNLRDFFTGGYTARDKSGKTEEVAADRVRARIREIIEWEDNERPLSDQTVSNMLKAEGIPIARRTVAKYRDEMFIRSARMRRRH
jgi:RNA polymerase sigma-54 factor